MANLYSPGETASAFSGDEWKDLVGMDAEEAKAAILKKYPNMTVVVTPEGSMFTADYNVRRIRLLVDKNKKVVKLPGVG
ncbi:hypothetical protein O6H91_02G121900 [Diphasiastrum complanatum]|uniref:Uncharacterized protein n=1 Tax=Diphasiastrum complanatum TaxID=34168 RepID=A0ACC2EKE6_DIPCM|nr:hypothetical protein O6H91_02G121900 [Diphasiastrum complanatum]